MRETLCEIPACKSNIIGWAQDTPHRAAKKEENAKTNNSRSLHHTTAKG